MHEFYDFDAKPLRLSRYLRISLIVLAGFLLAPAAVRAQQNPLSNLRQKYLRVKGDSLKIDTLSILPRSFSVLHVAASDYTLDPYKSVLHWKKKPDMDSVLITYRVYPFNLTAGLQRMNYDSVRNQFYVAPFTFTNPDQNAKNGMFDFGQLNANGSIGRQIGFGNKQDAVINSQLNLQLNGMLGDSIEISAAITDNNIPVQPDGNTQQLNEFDQVFLQFKKRNWQLSLGDIDLRRSDDYYLSFYKRLQGVSYSTTNRVSKNLVSKTLASGSIAKGKFNRQTLPVSEGNQGPYRLRGANNEFYFIVLANTEKVFLDGEQLQRGEDQDYVINYNSAEISFTPKRMITKDSRVQVEFEYADRNYLNANLYLSQEMDLGKNWKFRLGMFSNSDAKNSSINQDLDTKQKQFLANIGDSVNRAFYPTVIEDTLAAGKILYEKLFNGPDSFYRYSTDPATAHYSLSFVDVGAGNGDYVPDFNGANGKVYKYIAPLGSSHQGQYEPVQILVAPKTQQVISAGIDYRNEKNTWLKADAATSKTDVNTFSKLDKGNDRGYAFKIRFGQDKIFKNAAQTKLSTGADFEYVQSRFKPVERIRDVEFSRDWGLDLFPVPADERIIKANISLTDKASQQFSYELINYNRSDHYNGFQHLLRQKNTIRGWVFNNQLMITQFDRTAVKGILWRPVFDMSKQFRQWHNWRMGLRYTLEQNAQRDKNTDSLIKAASGFSFDTWTLYLKSDETKKNKYGISFYTRSDKYPVLKEFIRGDRSYNLTLQTELLKNEHRSFILNTTFRKLKVLDASVSPQKDDNTILGRAQYRMNEWKGLLNADILYELGAGQEQKRDFAYLEVPAGTGQYAWNDYNNDGIQQLNEFELAAFPDQAKFIRILTPTNEFIKANYITFNYSLALNPRSVMRSPNLKGFQKMLANTVLISSLQTNKKSRSNGDFVFNPFKYSVTDTALITSSSVINNSLSLNRFSSKWNLDLNNLRTNNKSLLTYGYETLRMNDWNQKLLVNFSRKIALQLKGKEGSRTLLTPQFANRNYDIRSYAAEPGLTYILGTQFKLAGTYRYEQRKNKLVYGGEKSVSHSLSLESKYTRVQRASLTGKFVFTNISYPFAANTAVSYVMLDGLLPGKNYIWSLTFAKRLINNLDLTIQYDGRKAGTSNTVHTGRAGVTASF